MAGVGAMPSENISLSESKTFSAKAKFSFEAIKTYLAQMAATAQNEKERRGGRVETRVQILGEGHLQISQTKKE